MRLLRRDERPNRLLAPALLLALIIPLGPSAALAQEREGTGDAGVPGAITLSQISGSWAGTWTRPDTGDSGGFTLTIGSDDDGQPVATFLGQAAVSVSNSPGSVTMTLEPASGCDGARLRFYFMDGLTDMHTCPLVNPGPVPHVGGPIAHAESRRDSVDDAEPGSDE